MPGKSTAPQARQEQATLEAIAKQFSSAPETLTGLHEPSITIDGKRISLDIRTLSRNRTPKNHSPKPRLRFDRVVIGLLNRLRASLGEIVPDGTMAIVSCTAPIRLPSKTAAAIQEKTGALLQRKTSRRDYAASIHGNRVRIRLAKPGSPAAPKFVGFVHNPESDPRPLLDLTEELVALLTARPGNQPAASADDRWIVVTGDIPRSWADACRAICAQAPKAANVARAIIALADGSAAVLSE